MPRRPGATGAARRRSSTPTISTAKPTATRAGRNKLKVVISEADIPDRLEELAIIEQRARVICDELKTYVRETGQRINQGGYRVGYERSVRDQMPKHDLVAKAWLRIEMLETGGSLNSPADILKVATELLYRALDAIDIRSWPNFLWKTGRKADILKAIADLDEEGDEGLYTHYGDPRLDIRRGDMDDSKSEECDPPARKK